MYGMYLIYAALAPFLFFFGFLYLSVGAVLLPAAYHFALGDVSDFRDTVCPLYCHGLDNS